jgi:hypothetical protein
MSLQSQEDMVRVSNKDKNSHECLVVFGLNYKKELNFPTLYFKNN